MDFSLKAVAGVTRSALPLELHALYLDRSAMLDRYLAALPAMSLIPFAPFFTADFLAPFLCAAL